MSSCTEMFNLASVSEYPELVAYVITSHPTVYLICFGADTIFPDFRFEYFIIFPFINSQRTKTEPKNN